MGHTRSRPKRRLSHPLCGSNAATLFKVLLENRGVARGSLPHAALAVLATLARWPASTLETAIVSRRLRSGEPMPAPIFIVGHWRSGTTHLYNILSKGEFGIVSPLAAGMPWDLLGLVRLIRPLLERSLPADRYIDRIPVTPDSPQEDEIGLANMTPLSFYHGIYFPQFFARNFNRGVFLDGCSEAERAAWRAVLTHFLGKVWLDQGHRRLIIKNPVYTARVAMLRQIYPDAKFIHIHRNPFEVFVSMRNFFDKLFAQFALQAWDHVDIDAVILETYSRMMEIYLTESAGLPADSLLEIRYDELDRDPLPSLEAIYRTFDLPGFDDARPSFEAYLGSVRTFQKNRFGYGGETIAKVERAWAPFLERWNYGVPQAIGN